MTRYCDDEIDEFKYRRALQEAADGPVVDAAMRDIIAGNLNSQAVHEVMSRRVGSINDYADAKDLYDVAVKVRIHTGSA